MLFTSNMMFSGYMVLSFDRVMSLIHNPLIHNFSHPLPERVMNIISKQMHVLICFAFHVLLITEMRSFF